MPSFDGGDDFVCIGGPGEGLWVVVGLVEEAVDDDLEVDNGAEDAAFQAPLRELREEASTALSQEQEVGTKWKVKRSWRPSQARTLACLWAA